ERQRERDQALLGAVVQVALEPAPLGITGLDDARTRRLELDEAVAQLRLEPLELDLGLLSLRDVPDDDHDLVRAAPDDPALDVAQAAAPLDLVLDGDDLARVEGAPDAVHDDLGDGRRDGLGDR